MQKHALESFNKSTVLLRLDLAVRASNEGTVDVYMPRSYMFQLPGCTWGVSYEVKVIFEVVEIKKGARVKKANEIC